MSSIPTLQRSDFVNRLINLLPSSWFSDSAKNPGGVLYAILDAWATNHQFLMQGVQWAESLTRISTATGSGLDIIAKDLLGPSFVRQPGEVDDSFRARIQFTVLQPRVTRQAIQNAIFAATGILPRMTEPWNPGDTCAYNETSFYDADVVGHPSRWGSDLAYQGMIDISTPLSQITGGQPLYGYNSGAAFDQFNTAFFGITSVASTSFISLAEQLTQQFKLFGTVIWMRFLLQTSQFLVGTLSFAAGATLSQVTDPSAQQILKSFLSSICTFFAIPPYNFTVWLVQEGVAFKAGFQGPAPLAGQISWFAAPVYSPPALKIPVLPNQTSVTINPSQGIGVALCPVCTPSWNTLVWIKSISQTQVVLGLDNNSVGGELHFGLLPQQNTTPIPQGTTSITIATPAGTSLPYAVFGLPSWNTNMSITKTNSSFTILFGAAAPTSAFLYWTILGGIP